MDALRRAFSSIGTTLSRLDASQKLLIGAIAIILAMTLFLVQLYSGQRDMVPLMPGEPADRQAIALQFVQDNGIDHDQEGGQVLVPRGERRLLLARMADASVLPGDSRVLFDNLIEKQSWTLSQRQNQQLEIVAVQNELAAIIGKMKGIRSASIILNLPEKRGLGQPSAAPSATATVFPETALDQNTVDAIAQLVAGARGINPASVRVIDGTSNRQLRARDEENMSASTYLEYVAAIESRKQRQIHDMLSAYIPGVIVSVHAQVDVTRRRTERNAILPEGKGSASMLKNEETTQSTERMASSGGEPGARSNTREDISGVGAGAGGSSQTTSTSEFDPQFGREHTIVEDPRGNPTKINAVVNIPRTYFTTLWKSQSAAGGAAGDAAAGAGGAGGVGGGQAGAAEPTDEQLKPIIEAETTRIRREVELQIDTSAGDQTIKGEVQVSMVPVVESLTPAAAGASAVLGVPMGTIAMEGAIKTIALGGLAVVALGMVVFTALKSTKREPLPSAEELVGAPPQLSGDADLIGEAIEADSVLQGLELSDEEMKSRKLEEQVTDLVEDKPEDAARVLGRWIAGT